MLWKMNKKFIYEIYLFAYAMGVRLSITAKEFHLRFSWDVKINGGNLQTLTSTLILAVLHF